MIGKPKFKVNDSVNFIIGNTKRIGTVFIVDKYGTFEDNSDVSYDIFVESENMLYKHINEKYVTKTYL